MRRLASVVVATVLVGLAGIAGASPASAHAIIELSGDPAYAGRTSVMTLEVQHGCLSNELGIDKVTATFDKNFGTVKPKSVKGWTSKVKAAKHHSQRIVWELTGSVPPFNQPTYFPMKIEWPSIPGVYAMPVTQTCDGEVNRWNVPDAPATADQPSPPLYPLPQVQVLAAP